MAGDGRERRRRGRGARGAAVGAADAQGGGRGRGGGAAPLLTPRAARLTPPLVTGRARPSQGRFHAPCAHFI